MLRIINDLKPFFEDCYRRISVREYAKIIAISPPTASKLLSYYSSEKLLVKSRYRNFLFFSANNENKQFIDLSRIYWFERMHELIESLEKTLVSPTIVLFGSLSKAEAKPDSDVDLAVFAHKKELNYESFEKKLKRKINMFWFNSIKDIKNKELANNMINGHILKGRLL